MGGRDGGGAARRPDHQRAEHAAADQKSRSDSHRIHA
jgi:hypothetical protein